MISPSFPDRSRDIILDGPDQLWVADLTYVAISAGFAYVAIILDAWSRRVVGYAIGRSIDAQLIVLKEFPSRYRRVLHCFLQCGFARAPSMPMTMLNIAYDSFDAYMTKALRSSTRKKLRKNLDATASVADIRMSVTDDAASFVDEIYPLYLQVFERSRMRFERG